MARELELRSALEEKRKKKGMTSGSRVLPDKYLGITSGGPSAGPVRTVREAVVTHTYIHMLVSGFAGVGESQNMGWAAASKAPYLGSGRGHLIMQCIGGI